jgi:glycosyltransferase involved in cell wall biosynthesis
MKDSDSLVSIIVPVYNADKVLKKCVSSIQAQSYSNIEIILIDDGSVDSSGEICDQLAKADDRVRVLHKSNGGISSAQNAGLDMAEGAYIAFCDNDDLMAPSCIDTLVRALENSEADMAKGRWNQLSPDAYLRKLEQLTGTETQPHRTITFSHAFAAYEGVFTKIHRILGGRKTKALYMTEANWGKLYKAHLWSGVRFPERRYAQDIAVMGILCSRSKRVVDVDAVVYFWVQNIESVSHTKNFEFCHDCVVSSSEVFEAALTEGITPKRSYFMMRRMLTLEAAVAISVADRVQRAQDWELFKAKRSKLRLSQRMSCAATSYIRRMESFIYDTVKTVR